MFGFSKSSGIKVVNSPVSLFITKKPPFEVFSASSYPANCERYPKLSFCASVPSLNFLKANPDAVLTSITSPSIIESMCPLIPLTDTSFCSPDTT